MPSDTPSAEEIAKAIADRFDVRWPIADETQFPPPVTPDQLKAFCVEALSPLLSRLAEAEKRAGEAEKENGEMRERYSQFKTLDGAMLFPGMKVYYADKTASISEHALLWCNSADGAEIDPTKCYSAHEAALAAKTGAQS